VGICGHSVEKSSKYQRRNGTSKPTMKRKKRRDLKWFHILMSLKEKNFKQNKKRGPQQGGLQK
jgi:hypothetical protein